VEAGAAFCRQGALELMSNSIAVRRRPQNTLQRIQKLAANAVFIKGTRGEAQESAVTILNLLSSDSPWEKADAAIAEFNKSLTYDPKKAGTLFNLGIVKWQGKKDGPGAVAAWKNLLETNPAYPDKDAVLQLMAQARQQR